MKTQKLLSYVRRAVDDYNMIQKNDKICVGLSGGKDSYTLLVALKELQRFYPKKYELCAVSVSLGFDGVDLQPMIDFCNRLSIEFSIVQTNIARIVFDERKESNPCSLCSKMRKGALNDEAERLGANKVALGHNKDDTIETFLMSLFYEGRIYAYPPVTYLDRKNIHCIRPLVYVPECEIKGFVKANNIPIIQNPCLANGNTKRQEMKEKIKLFGAEYDNFEQKMFGAMQRKLWTKEYNHNG